MIDGRKADLRSSDDETADSDPLIKAAMDADEVM